MSESFEWDEKKKKENLEKNAIDFHSAEYAFLDPKRVIAEDTTHGKKEQNSNMDTKYYIKKRANRSKGDR